MRIILIGGAGFIGTNIAMNFAKHGHQVVVLDREGISPDCFIKSGIEFIPCDYLSGKNIEESISEGDCVIHLVSTSLPNMSNSCILRDAEENIISSIKLLESCVKKKVAKIIYASSGGQVYGVPEYVPIDEKHVTNPQSAYGIHKLAVEKYVILFSKLYGIDGKVFRISNPYGPGQQPFRGQGVISTFIASAYMGKEIEIWGDGQSIRDYIYIDDLAEAFERILTYEGKEQVFNIGSGVGTSVLDILKCVEAVTGKKVLRRYLDAKSSDVNANILNCDKAEREFQWQSQISLFDGIKKMAEYWDEKTNQFLF